MSRVSTGRMEGKGKGWLFAILYGTFICIDVVSCQANMNGDIRLTGFSDDTKGRLEYYSNKDTVAGDWVQVCDDFFGYEEAMVVCRQLGFTETVTAAFITKNPFGRGGGFVWRFGGCTGSETALEDCGGQQSVISETLVESYFVSSSLLFYESYFRGESDVYSCDSSEQVGVNCVQNEDPLPELRLVEGFGDAYSGRVEINMYAEWGTICDNGFGRKDAKVICKQLGLPYTGAVVRHFGEGSGPIIYDDVECKGGEDRIDHCKHNEYPTDCDHSMDVGIVCSHGLRLVGGTDKYSGRVEVNIDDVWGTVCDDDFDEDNNAAKVVCRQLGLPHAYAVYRKVGLFGEGTGPVSYDDVLCNGAEDFLYQCSIDTTPNCGHSEDVGVICSNTEPVHTGAIQTYDHQFVSEGGSSDRWKNHRIFRIQEGAIVKFICPTEGQVGLNANTNNNHIDMFWNFDGVDIGKKGGPNVRPDGIGVKEDFQMYQNTGLGFNGRRGKRLLTMTYTARKEDNLKTLSCRLSDEDIYDSVLKGSSFNSNARERQSRIRLLVLPGPPALKYQSTITKHVWRGGFIGDILIPIDAFYNSWKMILQFPKDVYCGSFNVAREPCLHKGGCTKSRRTWVIYNTYENRVLSPLNDLHLTFVAHVSKKMTKPRGLIADIKFYGYNKVFGADNRPIWEPWE